MSSTCRHAQSQQMGNALFFACICMLSTTRAPWARAARTFALVPSCACGQVCWRAPCPCWCACLALPCAWCGEVGHHPCVCLLCVCHHLCACGCACALIHVLAAVCVCVQVDSECRPSLVTLRPAASGRIPGVGVGAVGLGRLAALSSMASVPHSGVLASYASSGASGGVGAGHGQGQMAGGPSQQVSRRVCARAHAHGWG